MPDPPRDVTLRQRLRDEAGHLLRVNPSDRPWELPFAAALAMGLPLLAGAAFHRLDLGLTGSLAGLVFLYLPNTPVGHRMRWLATCALGMTLCYALGIASHPFPAVLVPMITLVTMVSVLICRRHSVGPPGSLFFVMAAAIGAFSPVRPEAIPLFTGVFAAASLLAWVIGYLYTHATRRKRPPGLAPDRENLLPWKAVAYDALVAGIFTGLSLVVAQALHLQRAYWVPVSCVVVIQGVNLRAIWTRKVHRLIGTTIGLGLAWLLLLIPFDPWRVSLIVMGLAFIVEVIVVRQYALAVIFITPLAILLAETATTGHGSPGALIHARFLDTLLGCLFGFLGGLCLHSQGLRKAVTRRLG